jgi:glycosyltransferase involved in cell wall biosynthesis
MHILFFSHYFPPEGNAPASRTYENCKRWIRLGHRVTVITCAPNVPDGVVYKGYRNKLYKKEVIDGIDVIRVWTFITANKGTIRRIINYISYMFSSVFFSLFVRKPEVIIATSPQFFCGWAGLIASRMRHKPFVLEIRDIWPDSIVAVGAMRNKTLLRILEWLELKMYNAAEHIVTVGNGYKEKLIEKGIREEYISVITNGFDSEIFFPRQSNEKISRIYKPNHEFICAYVGTIGMACGLEVVLLAAERLKKYKRNNIKFLLVGSGAVKERLQKQAIESGLDNVVFVDRQDKNNIPDFLSITDACLVHLKKTELFKTVLPSKIFEAAAMAQPIILGVEGYAAQFLKEANAGICIEPENAEQLAQAVMYLADNPKICKSLGKSGYEYVTKYYNREQLANKYIDMITYLRNPEEQKVTV